MSNKLRFYTKEEMQLLEQFAKSGQPVGKKLIGDFCKVNKSPSDDFAIFSTCSGSFFTTSLSKILAGSCKVVIIYILY